MTQKFVCTNPDAKMHDDVPDASHGPLAFYRLFVDDVIQCMVEETNCNAKQVLESAVESRLKMWHETDAYEMRQFIGLLIWMGLVHFPSLDKYWSNDMLYCNSVATSVMKRNRFQLLLRLWHFAINNDNNAPSDRLHKIQHV